MICLLAALLAQDVGTLIERLRDEAPDVREEAADRLRARGPEAVPVLETLREADDPELRGRVRRLLREIALDATLHQFYRPGRPVSLSLADAPLAEAVEAWRVQTGETVRVDLEKLQGRVTLSLADVPAWEGLEALCRAAPALSWSVDGETLVLEGRPHPPFPVRVQEEFVVRLDAIVYARTDDFTAAVKETVSIGLNTAWERGLKPLSVEARLTAVLDRDGGSLLPPSPRPLAPPRVSPGPRHRRDEFRFSPPPNARGTAVDRVKGYVVATFPRAYEDLEVETGGAAPSLRAGDATVTVRHLRGTGTTCSFQLVLTYALRGPGASDGRQPPQNVRVVDDLGAEHAATSAGRGVSYAGAACTIHENFNATLPAGRNVGSIRLRILKDVLEKKIEFDFAGLPKD